MKTNKDIIKELIYLIKIKLDYHSLNVEQQKAFKYLELNFFKEFDKLDLSFKVQNTIFFNIGTYIEDDYYICSEHDLINNCLCLMN